MRLAAPYSISEDIPWATNVAVAPGFLLFPGVADGLDLLEGRLDTLLCFIIFCRQWLCLSRVYIRISEMQEVKDTTSIQWQETSCYRIDSTRQDGRLESHIGRLNCTNQQAQNRHKY